MEQNYTNSENISNEFCSCPLQRTFSLGYIYPHSCTHTYIHMHRRHTYVDTQTPHTHKKEIYFHTADCCVESVPAVQPQGNGELMDRTKIQLPTQSLWCLSMSLSM